MKFCELDLKSVKITQILGSMVNNIPCPCRIELTYNLFRKNQWLEIDSNSYQQNNG